MVRAVTLAGVMALSGPVCIAGGYGCSAGRPDCGDPDSGRAPLTIQEKSYFPSKLREVMHF